MYCTFPPKCFVSRLLSGNLNIYFVKKWKGLTGFSSRLTS